MERTDGTESRGSSETDRLSRTRRIRSAIGRRGRRGTIATLAGGILLATAAWTARRDRRRAGAVALVSAALLGIGLRRRRSEDRASSADDTERRGSAEADDHLLASDLVNQTETDPRGVAGEPPVETGTDPDEGDVQFATEQEVDEGGPKPHLDPADPEDPRYADEDDPETATDHVDVSLSETKMTDELGKVASPDEEQAYPAREGTDPEPMSDEAPERYGEGAVANEDTDGADETGDEEQVTDDEERASVDEESQVGDAESDGDGSNS